MRKEEVINKITPYGLTWESFEEWHYGQAYTKDEETGENEYYSSDVKRFIEGYGEKNKETEHLLKSPKNAKRLLDAISEHKKNNDLEH